jgi:hypothetical protein
MRKSLGVLTVAALAAAPIVFGAVSPAGARTATPRVVAVAVAHAAALPNSNIKGNATRGTLKYKPKTLRVTWSGPAGGTCSTSNIDFTVTNLTKKTQTMTYGGSTFATVGAGTGIGVCWFGSGKFTATFGLSGSSSLLTTKVS